MKKVYVDNSSTSFPKAPGISDVIKVFLDNTGCNVNRGGYADSYSVAMDILDTRQKIAEMFNAKNPQEVIFTPSVTYSLNMLMHGFIKKGDHVITTAMEHNAVMRPLTALSKNGITYDTIPCANDGSLNINDITQYIKKETKAVIMTHASNVNGTIMPIYEAAEICKKHKIKLIVDAAQTAGSLIIDVQNIDALAFTGHKGLLAPQGIGGFIIKKEFADKIEPIITGGTGSRSNEFEQPDFLPDKFESGTMNIPAILGLRKAVEYITNTGIEKLSEKKMLITSAFLSKINSIDSIEIIGKKDISNRVSVISIDFKGRDNAEIAHTLDNTYGIMTRCGLHCAPAAHKTLGTYPRGTVRFSFGCFNTMDEVEYIIESIKEILK